MEDQNGTIAGGMLHCEDIAVFVLAIAHSSFDRCIRKIHALLHRFDYTFDRVKEERQKEKESTHYFPHGSPRV